MSNNRMKEIKPYYQEFDENGNWNLKEMKEYLKGFEIFYLSNKAAEAIAKECGEGDRDIIFKWAHIIYDFMIYKRIQEETEEM
jgi:hypothetical protein